MTLLATSFCFDCLERLDFNLFAHLFHTFPPDTRNQRPERWKQPTGPHLCARSALHRERADHHKRKERDDTKESHKVLHRRSRTDDIAGWCWGEEDKEEESLFVRPPMTHYVAQAYANPLKPIRRVSVSSGQSMRTPRSIGQTLRWVGESQKNLSNEILTGLSIRSDSFYWWQRGGRQRQSL